MSDHYKLLGYVGIKQTVTDIIEKITSINYIMII